jgi:alpha-beta hydrolase superfamily lysophospholipase
VVLLSGAPGCLPTIVAIVGFSCAPAAFAAPAMPVGPPPPHHLFYLHGRIVQEQQSSKAVHPAFGVYDLDAIVAAFRTRGFTVHAAIRPKRESIDEAAARTVDEIRALLDSGVEVERIALVGASMGAAIGLEVAERLALPGLRVALLGACLSAHVEALRASGGRGPSGRLLAIREASDESTAGCASWPESANGTALTARELTVDTGLRHGFLYRPLPVWVDPVVAWLGASKPVAASTATAHPGGPTGSRDESSLPPLLALRGQA